MEEDLYYLRSENKGADQLCSYCTADLRLCFCMCRLLVFEVEVLLNNGRISTNLLESGHNVMI